MLLCVPLLSLAGVVKVELRILVNKWSSFKMSNLLRIDPQSTFAMLTLQRSLLFK